MKLYKISQPHTRTTFHLRVSDIFSHFPRLSLLSLCYKDADTARQFFSIFFFFFHSYEEETRIVAKFVPIRFHGIEYLPISGIYLYVTP